MMLGEETRPWIISYFIKSSVLLFTINVQNTSVLMFLICLFFAWGTKIEVTNGRSMNTWRIILRIVLFITRVKMEERNWNIWLTNQLPESGTGILFRAMWKMPTSEPSWSFSDVPAARRFSNSAILSRSSMKTSDGSSTAQEKITVLSLDR